MTFQQTYKQLYRNGLAACHGSFRLEVRRASLKDIARCRDAGVFFCCMGHHRDTCKYSVFPPSLRRRPWERMAKEDWHVFLLGQNKRPIFSGSLNKYPEWKITSSLRVPYLGWLDNLEKGIRYWFFMIFQLPEDIGFENQLPGIPIRNKVLYT